MLEKNESTHLIIELEQIKTVIQTFEHTIHLVPQEAHTTAVCAFISCCPRGNSRTPKSGHSRYLTYIILQQEQKPQCS